MKLFKFIIAFLIISNSVMAQTYNANDINSKISFVIKNIGLNVNGSFSGLKGIIIFDVKDLKSSEINVSVNSNSVNTDNSARDKHLRKDDYFDVEKFPLITFKSTKIEAATRLNRYNVEGNLNIKGIIKPIKFELIASEKDNNLELKCNFEINRRNFKVGGNSLVLSDNVKMNLNIVCNK
jgi:polyisoprenoid-binding protein YceI